ncbi:MAG TPA: Nif3-like dinuclear metal center hexameric protein [Armatimonadota bacterium]|jgi:putative NIF3 family GTP cyclohydrolase 1 type 2
MVKATEFGNRLISLFKQDKLDRFPEQWGLTIRGNGTISIVGYCTNLTPRTVDEAIRNGVDLILTHHDAWPFMFGMQEVCASKLEEHGISSAFFHYALDDADFGTNAALAEKLALRNIEKSALYKDLYYVGRIGEWECGKSFDNLRVLLENILCEPVRAWRNHDRSIKKVCIVTGSGAVTDLIKEAIDRGCDAYITGEKSLYAVEYAQFAGIDLFLGSHTATELPGVERLAQLIAEEFSFLQVVHLHDDPIE